MKYVIGITTFKRRESMLYSLIESIRKFTDTGIMVMVNADFKEPFDVEYAKRVLTFCSKYDNVIPTIFQTFTSLSKMWNTIIINSPKSYNLILNDDIDIQSDIFVSIDNYIDDNAMFKINNSFSHFVISKEKAITLNFFDERLLAFGEEDGDMTWKYENYFGQGLPSLYIDGINNKREGYRDNSSKLSLIDIDGYVFRPSFNRNYIFGSLYNSGSGPCGMFGSPHKRICTDMIQYPYEQFKIDNFDKLG